MKDFDEEFEAILNVAGGYYPPNNPKVLKKYYEKEFESKSENPLNISSIDCFDEYEKIQQSEFISTILQVHLADEHLAPTGFIMFPGSKKVLVGDKEALPMEHIAKGTVMQ